MFDDHILEKKLQILSLNIIIFFLLSIFSKGQYGDVYDAQTNLMHIYKNSWPLENC